MSSDTPNTLATAQAPAPDPATPWWAPFYDDLLSAVLLESTDSGELERTVDFLVDALELAPGARVFDQCCGIGRLSLPLARRGYRVVGVDQAAGYIANARREAEAAGLSAEFHAADAFEWRPDAPCDAAFNWWTSFGYPADDATNQRMLARAFEALRPGGVFLLDFMNVANVLHRFERHVVTRRATPEGELVLVRESRVELARGVIEKRWTYFLPDGRRVAHDSTVRAYLPHEIGRLLERCRFTDLAMFGGIDRSPLTLESPRLIVRARRPA